MSADESKPATLKTVAEELNERAANMRARNPDANKISKEEAALQFAIVLMGAMKERGQTIPYSTEYYAQRVLHLVLWSGGNIGAGVMIEYLIHHSGNELEVYFDRLLDQTGYRGGDDLPEDMRKAIQRMRNEGRDPVESYTPGDNERREIWRCTVEQMRLMEELDPTAWPDIVAPVKEMEARHPQLRNREMLIEELTARFVNALKANNLPMPHGRDWYRNRIAALMFHHTHPLFAGIIFTLLLGNFDDRTRELEEELKLSEDQFAKAFRAGPAAMVISALDTGCILDLNDGFLKLFGFEREQVIGKTGAELGIWADPEDRKKFFAGLRETGSVRNQQTRFRTKAGKPFDSLISAEAINFGGKECLLSVILDVSEQMRLEEQLRQAQKMEAVGTLSGGIAHDFNNALTVIRGYSQILLDALESNPELRLSVEHIDEAAEKAASLTRQLLAFSRQQVLQPKVLSLNTVVVNLEDMLRRLLGENIDIRVVMSPDLGLAKADANQIEHAVMNLAVNARDAMPEGGKLTLETANVFLDEDYAREHRWVKPGPFVMLSVADTGMGMQAETLNHIFDPFFTTKGLGKGTGLGLSMVYGIVKQSGGNISVYSEPGKGTTFKVYLPRVYEALQTPLEKEPLHASVRGNETILLVEDDLGVRQLAQTTLTSAGYTVLIAENAAHASSLCEAYSGSVQLLLTDVVMPGMGGRELAREITARKPEAKVLYMSGYAVNAVVHHGVLDAGTFFLAKPFSAALLLAKVREVLDKPR